VPKTALEALRNLYNVDIQAAGFPHSGFDTAKSLENNFHEHLGLDRFELAVGVLVVR